MVGVVVVIFKDAAPLVAIMELVVSEIMGGISHGEVEKASVVLVGIVAIISSKL